MRSAAAVSLALLLLLGSPSCATRRENRGVEVAGLDRKLSTFAFIEDGDLGSFIVDTRSSRNREEGSYLPLEICVANRRLKQISLTRESFTLVDQEGNRYPCAGPKELIEGYPFLDMDRSLAELGEIVVNKFATFTPYPSKFSPTRQFSTRGIGSSLVHDSVNLPKFGFMIDFIYFPRPKTGVLNQRFELFMQAPELPDPVFVKFMVL